MKEEIILRRTSEKGITLVTLIITVIIITFLSAVVVNEVVDREVVDNAKEHKNRIENQEAALDDLRGEIRNII